MYQSTRILKCAIAAISVACVSSANASIVVQHEYLFEDPTKVAGDALSNTISDPNNTITDTVGTINMQNEGNSGFYSASTPTNGTTSTLSADFTENPGNAYVVAVPAGLYWGDCH